MNVKREKVNGSMVLFVQEERIDAHNSADFKELMLQLLEQGETDLVVQLQSVRFIDSSGLGALLAGLKNATAKSGKFTLTNIQPQVLSMFELTRLNRVFEIYPNLQDVFASDQ